jgi:hypothetical protein
MNKNKLLIVFIITLGLFSVGPCFAQVINDMLGNSSIRSGYMGMANAERRDTARQIEIISIAFVVIVGIILLIKKIVKKQKIGKLIICLGIIIIAILVIIELYIFSLS